MWLVAHALAWDLRGPSDVPAGATVQVSTVFTPVATEWSGARVSSNPAAVRAAADDALRYIRAHPDDPACDAGMFAEIGVSGPQFEATLSRLVNATDAQLTDPAWLSAQFTYYRWTPPPGGRTTKLGLAPGELRLTRYLVVQVEGRTAPEPGFDQAIYADPGEPWRNRYTRRQVMEGAYTAGEGRGQAQPLAWLAEANVHDAIMQGSVEVSFPDGTRKLLNVEASNGIAYQPSKRGRDQDRYWYFAEVQAPRGYGVAGGDHVAIEAGVTVAGDVYNLGLGRLVVIEHPSAHGTVLRLAVLGDTGGAFQPNLSQLDWFGGAFPTHQALYAAWSDLPDRVRAGILVAK